MAAKKLKTRSSVYYLKMSDEVLSKIETIAKKSGYARWLVAEQLLEKALGIKSGEQIELKQWMKKR